MNVSKALVVVAHPDDEVLGAGGTILRVSEAGGQVTVLVLSEGTSAQYPDDPDASRKRHEQLQEACDKLGVHSVEHWDYPDMRLDTVPHLELNARLLDFVRTGGFDSVFTHHAHDVNKDHQVVHQSVLVACRPTPGQTVERLLTFHVNSATEWGSVSRERAFAPNVYVDVSKTLEAKLAAFACYLDEQREYPHPRSLRAIEDRARVFGADVGYESAEAFELLYARIG